MRIAIIAYLIAAPLAAQQPTTIGTIDYYGIRHVSDSTVRAAVGLAVGDSLPESSGAVVRRLEAIPGVAEAQVSAVCCAAKGGVMLYVGIREAGVPPAEYRASPTGAVRLPDSVRAAGDAFEKAFQQALEAGDFAEDDSHGYTLMHFPAARGVEETFPALAAQYGSVLSDVLRHSASAHDRAFATQLTAYTPDKRAAVPDLVYALGDQSPEVRNNAARALWVMGMYATTHPDAGITIPAKPFISMLHSVDWTDRNKGSLALMALTQSRDSALLSRLEAEALPDLVEMAEWSDFGHAAGALMILGRIEGLADSTLGHVMRTGERGAVLEAVPAPR